MRKEPKCQSHPSVGRKTNGKKIKNSGYLVVVDGQPFKPLSDTVTFDMRISSITADDIFGA